MVRDYFGCLADTFIVRILALHYLYKYRILIQLHKSYELLLVRPVMPRLFVKPLCASNRASCHLQGRLEPGAPNPFLVSP